jgi:glycosyltransferase involved in cell wall biosynthesis
MPEPVRLLLVANFSDRVGGGEESLLALAGGLDQGRFHPHAVVPSDGEVAEALRALGIPVTILALPPLRPWGLRAAGRSLRTLRSLLVATGVHLVHTHGSRGTLYAGLAARRSRVPVIWHVRIAERDPWLDGLLLRLSTRIIAISTAVKSRFDGRRQAEKVRVVYNGVDPTYWASSEPRARTGAPPTVLCVGRLSPQKGQATLLQAIPLVRRRVPSVRVLFVGADVAGEAERLRGLADRLGVGDVVEFRRWMPDPRPAFAEADLIALPSRSEGFGRVLVEAAFLAIPAVASRVGGIPEVVADGQTGLLVPPDDPAALAQALTTLLADPERRHAMGQAARTHALARFTIRRHVDGVEEVYADVLDH